jgi:hypothetical protein
VFESNEPSQSAQLAVGQRERDDGEPRRRLEISRHTAVYGAAVSSSMWFRVSSVDLQLSVDAYNDGSFTGAADSTSATNIRGESASRLFRINP